MLHRFFGTVAILFATVSCILAAGVRKRELNKEEQLEHENACSPSWGLYRGARPLSSSSVAQVKADVEEAATKTLQPLHYLGCDFGRLCTGPSEGALPVLPGSVWYTVFEVPPLPAIYDPKTMTYYNYFNIFFDRVHKPEGAKFNQFVPQLMLGNVLANSSGAPLYEPQWLELDTWHFGAQYFMGLLEDDLEPSNNNNNNITTTTNTDPEKWTPRAAVGEVFPVQPGEFLTTVMSLSPDGQTWNITMSVVRDLSRTSTLIIDRPFMGLLNSTTSWTEYRAATPGSCWENYGMVNKSSYPPFWHQVHKLTSPQPQTSWSPWTTGPRNTGTCPTKPSVQVISEVSGDHRTQTAVWDIRVTQESADEEIKATFSKELPIEME